MLFTQTAFPRAWRRAPADLRLGQHNEWFSRVVGNVFVGLSFGWWMRKHSKHHANPNKIGKDGDIDHGRARVHRRATPVSATAARRG